MHEAGGSVGLSWSLWPVIETAKKSELCDLDLPHCPWGGHQGSGVGAWGAGGGGFVRRI